MTTDSLSPDDVTGEFLRYLGVELTEMGPDRVEARWTAGPHLHQPYGIVHGGVYCSVVETVASVGAAIWLAQPDRSPDAKVVGASNSTDFYRAVREGDLVSVGTPIHRGRSQQVWLVETHDEEGRLASRGQVRLQHLYPDAAG